MATAVGTPKRVLEPEQRVVIRGVGWEGYESLLAMVGDGHVRLAFDGEDVELMSPSVDHDRFKRMIGRLIETLTLELDVPCESLGSPTWRKRLKQRGLEPDECFYLASSATAVGRRQIDLSVDPPPDLAIEIEISRSALDRMAVYAAIGLPEVWRFNGERLVIEVLQSDGTYASTLVSPGLPAITPEEIVRWVRLSDDAEDDTEWSLRFRDWVRDELVPRHQAR